MILELSGAPAQGALFRTADAKDGTLIEVDEPLVFDVSDPVEITLGDTITIGGTVYTVTDQWTGAANHNDPLTGAPTNATISGALITVSDGTTDITWAVPFDGFGDLQGITQITFDTLDTTLNPDLVADTLDDNDFVTLICFAAGTRIATASGMAVVDALCPGDLMHTADHVLQPVRWMGCTTVAATDDHAPITIKAGALGNDLDLRVSPQHRMLVTGWRADMNGYGRSVRPSVRGVEARALLCA